MNIPEMLTHSATPCERQKVNCDQEAWLKNSLKAAIFMAFSIRSRAPDGPLFEEAIDGLINGAAIEIIDDLGLEPSYSNIRARTRWV